MDDKELINNVINGNTHAFRFLVEQNKNLVWHMVLRMVRQQEDAEDLCQDVFMRVFRDIRKFRGDSKLSTWIASITYHICVDYIRRKGREKTDLTDDPASFIPDERDAASPSRSMNMAELKQLVNRVIDRLPLHYRTVITLFHLEEMSYKEIEEITGMPEGTIKSYLNRGRQAVREQMLKIVPDIQPVLFDAD
ncbi:MAG: RNA polymerase sigma factor [Bacteroidetes bacterium]|nr:RNA polymerase sigma factor [Bacteroidota bacterium]